MVKGVCIRVLKKGRCKHGCTKERRACHFAARRVDCPYGSSCRYEHVGQLSVGPNGSQGRSTGAQASRGERPGNGEGDERLPESLPNNVTDALERLGLNRYGLRITKEEIKKAFNAIMRFVHPDKTGGVTEGIAICLIADRELVDQWFEESQRSSGSGA